ncbi:hypothetical protein AC249_AIPGENE8622 [Exaiptasia diaphana]|nr:hypothetical protein AC249_AIPGENE8622 [Exaiptasia diaphana]
MEIKNCPISETQQIYEICNLIGAARSIIQPTPTRCLIFRSALRPRLRRFAPTKTIAKRENIKPLGPGYMCQGGGGGGFYSSGRSGRNFNGSFGTGGEGGKGFLQGGVGGRSYVKDVPGGFGGGGGPYGWGGGAGGGGGYSGGACGDNNEDSSGGGGGSYNNGSDQANTCCYNSQGHGYVLITRV